MSDLSRLRARLVRIEATGKRLKRELAELQSIKLSGLEPLTRTEEQRILRIEAEIDQARKDYVRIRALVSAEEHRLLAEPTAFLRFT